MVVIAGNRDTACQKCCMNGDTFSYAFLKQSSRQRHLFFLTDDNYNSPSDMISSV